MYYVCHVTTLSINTHTHTHMLSLHAPVHPSVGVSFFTCLRLINYSNYLVSIINFTVAVCAVFLPLTVMSQTHTHTHTSLALTRCSHMVSLPGYPLASQLPGSKLLVLVVYTPPYHTCIPHLEKYSTTVQYQLGIFFSVVASSPHSGQVPSLAAFQ